MAYLPAGTITALRGSVHLGYYFHLATPTPFRLWSGPADIMQTLPGIDTVASLYQGARLQNFPELDVILNAGAARFEFSLEGVSDDSAEKIAGLEPEVLGCRVHIGFAVHGENWQPTTTIYGLGLARADFWGMRQTPGDPPQRGLYLSAVFGESGRKRPRRMTYSDAQQQALWPGDTFCKDVPRYHRGYIAAWPRF